MADEPAKSGGGGLAKVIGGIFGAVIAPVAVAVGIKYLDPKPATPPPDPKAAVAPVIVQVAPALPEVKPAPTPAPETKPSIPAKAPTPATKTKEKEKEKAPPPVALKPPPAYNFVTPNLSEYFYTYGYNPDKKGNVYDPKVDARLFHVIPGTKGGNILHVPGEFAGALVSKLEYQHYSLHLEYKWGEKTYKPNENGARRSGLILHGTGADGSIGPVSMPGFQCTIHEGSTGNLQLLGKEKQVSATVHGSHLKKSVRYDYDKDGPAHQLTSGELKLPWLILRTGLQGTKLKDEKGQLLPGDIETPSWNKLDCICDGDTISIHLNGKEVNALSAVVPRKGKILLLSSGAELFIRRFELQGHHK